MISQEQVVAKLRSLGFRFIEQKSRVQLYRQSSSGRYVNVPRRDYYEDTLVRVILGQAGLTHQQVNDFIAGAVK